MALTAGGCRDLRKYMDDPQVADIFGKLISGKSGYKTIIDKDKPVPMCKSCGLKLLGDEKFCPECGTKVEAIQPQQDS
ncbi:hypothetical protein CO154_01375 [Candidatus Pacearchaeota archaeon CG_4_9_14_3_um_filter_31_7]|nr:MAG: hypothetical protein AUJ10_03105 [Candidatus Pacearchaeota archaeon CG1_02_31_27]PIN92395.1 MAG: hypothetical protein COU55_01150 [Candidatus Pacearchaeota archaeon CG10_big_fil_rev_8_21_14_0_10_31_59]PIZ80588.1 MAG: hypothetical protein COX99_02150 [Candidatus Pacearchaeota archaeon CG_4_10_14_0_2_um_filter_31_10]PJA70707.1 MAG: hypothetical protein CO154_01375 [Candidatus Pacearchaeota archaeon CG_4_9_14_3_um_filter_31_7]